MIACTGRYHRRRIQLQDDVVEAEVKPQTCSTKDQATEIAQHLNLSYIEIALTTLLTLVAVYVIWKLLEKGYNKWKMSIERSARLRQMGLELDQRQRSNLNVANSEP